jgi:hypothetical protein
VCWFTLSPTWCVAASTPTHAAMLNGVQLASPCRKAWRWHSACVHLLLDGDTCMEAFGHKTSHTAASWWWVNGCGRGGGQRDAERYVEDILFAYNHCDCELPHNRWAYAQRPKSWSWRTCLWQQSNPPATWSTTVETGCMPSLGTGLHGGGGHRRDWQSSSPVQPQ